MKTEVTKGPGAPLPWGLVFEGPEELPGPVGGGAVEERLGLPALLHDMAVLQEDDMIFAGFDTKPGNH